LNKFREVSPAATFCGSNSKSLIYKEFDVSCDSATNSDLRKLSADDRAVRNYCGIYNLFLLNTLSRFPQDFGADTAEPTVNASGCRSDEADE
jgi:hypothetical protein